MGKGRETDEERGKLPKVEQLAKQEMACFALCAGKDCAKAGAKQIIQAARAAHAAASAGRIAAEVPPVVLTKCQDECDHGPVMTVLPEEYPYRELTPAATQAIVTAHIVDQAPVFDLLPKKLRRKLAGKERV